MMALLSVARSLAAGPPEPTQRPLLRAIDLEAGESAQVELSDGTKASVTLIAVHEVRDAIRSAVREARVELTVNGQRATLISATYHLPATVGGVQVDCPITKDYLAQSTEDHWGLQKTARLRLWPARSPWLRPGTFVYPVRQRWFASSTQMANEPVYVDGGENPASRSIYYHSGLDIGGAEGLIDVLSATDGLVVSAATDALEGYADTPAAPRYDVVYVLDDQGWYYRYSHLQSIDPAIKPGSRVKMSQRIGVLGKEGGSGGWSHLHFEIVARQPSGRWGTQEGYAFLWEAALREQQPEVVAVARPHHFVWTGQHVTLDASRSWSRSGPIVSWDWVFTDGSTASGSRVDRVFEEPGSYSEILKVADAQGHVSYDFAIVQVLDKNHSDRLPPTIHAAYAPTQEIHPGDPVTFKVRTFRTTAGSEQWDFGDGTPPVRVHSDGNVRPLAKDGYAATVHRFDRPGDYLVRVHRANEQGLQATGRLHVRVEARAQGK